MPHNEFEFIETGISGLKLIERKINRDNRGSFSRIFSVSSFENMGFASSVSQINISKTRQLGSVRGLHFQHPPHAETKIINCIKGSVFDVAVDLRCNSSTFLQWRSVILSEDAPISLLIPAGFAHGFQTLDSDCELLYFHSTAYAPESEDGFHPADPRLNIAWPMSINNLSDRDQRLPSISHQFQGISL